MKYYIIILYLITFIVSCSKQNNLPQRIFISFKSSEPIEKVSYILHELDYQKFNGVGNITKPKPMVMIDSTHFTLDTILVIQDFSKLRINSFGSESTINNVDYEVVMKVGSNQKVTYKKSFKGDDYTQTEVEF